MSFGLGKHVFPKRKDVLSKIVRIDIQNQNYKKQPTDCGKLKNYLLYFDNLFYISIFAQILLFGNMILQNRD